jgi:hypothetical protein
MGREASQAASPEAVSAPVRGSTLFFGDAAAAVLKRSDRSILLVAS